MDTTLLKLIRDYQAKVAEAVQMLEVAGIPRPASTMEWVCNQIAQRGSLPNGFKYFKHGFGCAVAGPDWNVDFDFGERGQIDGFDAWRLFDFAEKNLTTCGFRSLEQIEEAVRVAAQAGSLEFSGYILYYTKCAP